MAERGQSGAELEKTEHINNLETISQDWNPSYCLIHLTESDNNLEISDQD